MEENLLTAGQFAKLASTTKRTVTWYDQEGILEPFFIDETGYRFYKPEQIIDFQVILLLRQLNFSIDQIKEFLSKNASLKDLFRLKRKLVVDEISRLKRKLDTIDNYYDNFEKEGVLVKPKIINAPTLDIYYLQKEGPYSKIYEYGLELKSYFKKLPKNAVFIAVFEEPEFKPVKSKFKVGVVISKVMELKKETKSLVLRTSLPQYKALSYTHNGSPSLLSFHWKQLGKYAASHKLEPDLSLPFIDVELYKRTGFNNVLEEDQMVTEMRLPIK